MNSIIIIISAYLFVNFQVCVGIKPINIAFFLNENDTLEEIVINSTVKYATFYSAPEYDVNPLIYRYNELDVSTMQNTVCDMLSKGVSAFFGPEQSEINEIVQSVALNFRIPHFQTSWNSNLKTFTRFARADNKLRTNEVINFNLYPNPHTLSKAFATLVRENDWTGYTVIYESDDALVRLQQLFKAQNPDDPPVTYRKLGPDPDHRRVLKEIKINRDFHIILDCHVDHIIDILSQAKKINLLEEYHAYLLTSLDAHTVDFSALGEIKANISFVSIIHNVNLEKLVGDWKLAGHGLSPKTAISPASVKIKTALLQDAITLFITTYKELDQEKSLTAQPLDCRNIDEYFAQGRRLARHINNRNLTSSGRFVRLVTGPIILDNFGQRSSFDLKISELNKDELRMAGTWTSNKPDSINATISSEDREKQIVDQLKGKVFKVASKIGAPYLSRKTFAEGQRAKDINDAFEGYSIDLIDGICKILECKYEFHVVPDNKYGNFDKEKKEWNGLIKEILDRQADLAICDLTTTSERRQAVDFTNPFMTLGISILYSNVVKEPPDLLAFTNPLALDVWLYMATTYIIISVIIFIVARLNSSEWENPHPCNPDPDELENIWDIKNCFWLTLGSVLAQGCDILPKGISTRVVTGMWWFFSMIMAASYTANLTAFLTMERMGPTINSAEDLAQQNKIKYGCLKDGATSSFFKETNVSTYHKMWLAMEHTDPSAFEKSNKDGVKRVIEAKGKFAFLMESSTIEYEMSKQCGLVQVGDWLDTKGYGIAMPINYPFRTAINQAILKMQELGKLKQLKDKWWRQQVNCDVEESSNEAATRELDLPHVGGIFVVLGVGMAIGLTMAFGEFLWNVKKIAISRQIPMKEAFSKEMRFALNIWARQKEVDSAED